MTKKSMRELAQAYSDTWCALGETAHLPHETEWLRQRHEDAREAFEAVLPKAPVSRARAILAALDEEREAGRAEERTAQAPRENIFGTWDGKGEWCCRKHTPRPSVFTACNCGNKRCPHADDCAYLCTRSNEPGQIGVLADASGPAAGTSDQNETDASDERDDKSA